MHHGHSQRSRPLMTRENADRLLESLRPTRHLLTRTLADIPNDGSIYRQVDRVVQEIDGLARILIGDESHYCREGHPARLSDADHCSSLTLERHRATPQEMCDPDFLAR